MSVGWLVYTIKLWSILVPHILGLFEVLSISLLGPLSVDCFWKFVSLQESEEQAERTWLYRKVQGMIFREYYLIERRRKIDVLVFLFIYIIFLFKNGNSCLFHICRNLR